MKISDKILVSMSYITKINDEKYRVKANSRKSKTDKERLLTLK